MSLRRQLFYAFGALLLIALLCEAALAEVSPSENNINNLYENLLQREYAGPIVFPNHQVERKAQRSPSLRLRFGRRSDPDMLLQGVDKRWFGDVNQKPIRSPSLRLRFGRRSDPSMPMHSNFDILMNDWATVSDGNGLEQDYDTSKMADSYEAGYERAIRKPQRLRWGRSVPAWQQSAALNTENENEQQHQRANDFLNSLLASERLRSMLMSLRRYDSEFDDAQLNADNDNDDEFARQARKPARLRWGRSTGGVHMTEQKDKDEKKVATPNAMSEDKSETNKVQATKN